MERGSEFNSGTDAATPPKVRAGNGEHVSQEKPAFPDYGGFGASGVSPVMTGPPSAQGQVVVGFQQNHPAAGLQPAPQRPSTYIDQLVHENVTHRQRRNYKHSDATEAAIFRRQLIMLRLLKHSEKPNAIDIIISRSYANARSPINLNNGPSGASFPPPLEIKQQQPGQLISYMVAATAAEAIKQSHRSPERRNRAIENYFNVFHSGDLLVKHHMLQLVKDNLDIQAEIILYDQTHPK